MSIHKARMNSDRPCPVCGVEPLHDCLFGQVVGEDMQHDLQREWAEFQLLAAVNTLADIDPNHYLVRLVRAGLNRAFNSGDIPSLLRRQAD